MSGTFTFGPLPYSPYENPPIPVEPATQPSATGARVADPVADARRLIAHTLDESNFAADVNHTGLMRINDVLHRLTPAQRADVVTQLETGQLQTWAREIDSSAPGPQGGLSGPEKKALFSDLAQGLNGAQLLRLAGSFGGDLKRLGEAVGQHASPAAALAFVKGLRSQVTSNPAAAAAVGQVIAGRRDDPRSVTAAVASLDAKQLEAVIDAASPEIYMPAAPSREGIYVSPLMSYDVAPLVGLLDAVAETADNFQKARVFELAGARLGELSASSAPGAGAARKTLTDALCRVLTSDTNGVMGALEESAPAGRGLTALAEQLFRQGRESDLRAILDFLCKGNDLKGDPSSRLAEITPDNNAKQASTLGHFIGALNVAVTRIDSDADKQAALIGGVFKLGLSVAKDGAALANPAMHAVAKFALSVAVATASALSGPASDALSDTFKSGYAELLSSLEASAWPSSANGQKLDNDRLEAAFRTARDEVGHGF